MRFDVETQVPQDCFDYVEKTLITGNGFREYDVRWLLGKEINPNGFLVLGKAFGTFPRKVLRRPSVVVGHDFRIYSQDVCRSFVAGLLSSGVNVVDIGITRLRRRAAVGRVCGSRFGRCWASPVPVGRGNAENVAIADHGSVLRRRRQVPRGG